MKNCSWNSIVWVEMVKKQCEGALVEWLVATWYMAKRASANRQRVLFILLLHLLEIFGWLRKRFVKKFSKKSLSLVHWVGQSGLVCYVFEIDWILKFSSANWMKCNHASFPDPHKNCFSELLWSSSKKLNKQIKSSKSMLKKKRSSFGIWFEQAYGKLEYKWHWCRAICNQSKTVSIFPRKRSSEKHGAWEKFM